MRELSQGAFFAAGVVALAIGGYSFAASKEEIISSAMSAAPEAIAKDATIATMKENGKLRVIREGTNGFTCMPDSPSTPGPDPMCMDANAMEWVNAWVGKKAPPAGKIGFMYMLAGGTDASNTDPHASAPGEGNHWIESGPHVMVVGAPVATMMSGYPGSPDPDITKPFVMWAGTPYEHVMFPVK